MNRWCVSVAALLGRNAEHGAAPPARAQRADVATVFMNEPYDDNVGIDTGEAIEIVGPARTVLTGWQIMLDIGTSEREIAMLVGDSFHWIGTGTRAGDVRWSGPRARNNARAPRNGCPGIRSGRLPVPAQSAVHHRAPYSRRNGGGVWCSAA